MFTAIAYDKDLAMRNLHTTQCKPGTGVIDYASERYVFAVLNGSATTPSSNGRHVRC